MTDPSAPASPAVAQARATAIAALLAFGEHAIANLNGATPEDLAETDRLMDEAKFCGIVLHETLIEEGEDA